MNHSKFHAGIPIGFKRSPCGQAKTRLTSHFLRPNLPRFVKGGPPHPCQGPASPSSASEWR